MLEANEMKVLKKIVDKTNVDKIRSQHIRGSCGIQHINEQVERKKERKKEKREWDQHITRMVAERLDKTSKDNIPFGKEYTSS